MLALEARRQHLTSQARDEKPLWIHENDCKTCKKKVTLVVKGLCVGCWLEEIGKALTWVPCGRCSKEWSKLREGGICPDCFESDEKDHAKQAAIHKKIKAIFGSPEATEWYGLSNFDQIAGTGEAYLAAMSFEPKTDNLYFWGQCGRGKTHLAYAVGLKYLLAGKKVENVSVRELFNRFRMKRPEEEAMEMAELTNADVLIIDDLGVSKATDFSLEILCEIINKRTLKLKNGLIITSNLSLDDLARKNQDDRLSSRLLGMCKVIEIATDVDYRAESKA